MLTSSRPFDMSLTSTSHHSPLYFSTFLVLLTFIEQYFRCRILVRYMRPFLLTIQALPLCLATRIPFNTLVARPKYQGIIFPFPHIYDREQLSTQSTRTLQSSTCFNSDGYYSGYNHITPNLTLGT